MSALPAAFAYDLLPPDIAEKLRGQADRIVARLKRHTAEMIEAGRDLAAVRDTVNVKTFAAWVEFECGINVRTAQLYIRAAETFGDREIISQIAPTAAMKLAAKSVPIDVREGLIGRLESGERIRMAEIDEAVRKAKKPRPAAKEWDTSREIALAMAAVEGKRRKTEKAIDDERALADFYSAWATLPESLRSEALREINADAYLRGRAA